MRKEADRSQDTVTAHTFLKEEFEAAGTLYIATEDGSVGTKGNVMDAIREHASECRRNLMPADRLRCFVPSKSMQKKTDIECYISLEERMACGIGACLACVCKSKEIDAPQQCTQQANLQGRSGISYLRRWKSDEYEQ